jgi:hypothetical protein
MGLTNGEQLVKRYPDRISQLKGPVRSYLSKYGPFPTDQSLFMAVFYPAARSWPITQSFPLAVQAVNPGIRTPADYIAKVYGRKVGGSPLAVFALLAAAAAFFLLNRKRIFE